MKKIITILTFALLVTAASAQSNALPTLTILPILTILDTSTTETDSTHYDITFSAGGIAIPHGSTDSSISLSLSLNPIKGLRPLWFGLAQGFAWKPVAGSTDLDAEWQIPVYKDTAFVLPAWSAGTVYGQGSPTCWRTGPEVIGQWYFCDKLFAYVQVNFDMNSIDRSGFRWGAGLGAEFN